MIGLSIGFFGFIILAWILSKYPPKFAFFNNLMLEPPKRSGGGSKVVITAPAKNADAGVRVGDIGVVTSTLRPAGVAKFDEAMVDVVSDGEFVNQDVKVKIVSINGNRVTVEPITE